eukprot:Rmarinus@m.23581
MFTQAPRISLLVGFWGYPHRKPPVRYLLTNCPYWTRTETKFSLHRGSRIAFSCKYCHTLSLNWLLPGRLFPRLIRLRCILMLSMFYFLRPRTKWKLPLLEQTLLIHT